MGTLRLLVPEAIIGSRRLMATLHMVRFDSMPWPCRIEIDDSRVTLHRIVNHSGQISLAYPVPEFGELTLRTGTLPEREIPYSLPVELARGTCDRLRTQIGIWGDASLPISSVILQASERAVEALAEAALLDGNFARQIELSHSAIGLALRGLFDLCRQFSDHVAAIRREEIEPKTRLGVRIAPGNVPSNWLEQIGPEYQLICVTDALPKSDRPATRPPVAIDLQLLAGLERRKIMIGPIWDAGKTGLPDQINELSPFDAKRTAARAHFVRMLNQIQDQPDWLYLASGLNGIGHKFLSYPQQMQLVVDALQTVEEFNRQVPVLLSFDHPWSERLAWSVGGSQGLQMADILLRQDVRISGLGLEINLDYWPTGSLPRDPLQWLELVDTWAQFGLPLFLLLRAPTGDTESTAGKSDTSVGLRNSFSESQQRNFLESVLSVAISRPFVQAVIWNDWQDDPQGPFPFSGLFDASGNRKPIAALLSSVFRRFSKSGISDAS